MLAGKSRMVPVLLMCMLSGSMSVQGIILNKAVNPEASMNISQLIEYWGYPCEMHNVVTEDGYILDLFHIPHGRGNNSTFIAFSTNPILAAKIKILFCLAPAATVKYAKSPLRILTFLPDTIIKALLGKNELLPDTSFGDLVTAEFCSKNAGSVICSNLLFTLNGFNEKNLNISRIDVYASHALAGTSVKNILHWKQAIRSGKFQAYNYGSAGNLVHYKQHLPLHYNVSAMMVPTAMWSGGNDWLSDPRDVALLIPKIRSLIFHRHAEDWNHQDFVLGFNAREVMYDKILDMLQQNPILEESLLLIS